MVTRTEAIAAFLKGKTLNDLSALYDYSMECQVNVAQDGGERVNKTYKGHNYHVWTDGIDSWKPIRIPRNASTIPEFSDVPMDFNLEEHAEGIGMTGWDWVNQCSKWVGFDFDSIIGHSKKSTTNLTPEELEEVKNRAKEIPWVTVRKSTSGKGLHLYVYLDNFPTENHTEHAALARAILGTMSAICSFDFKSKVDVCGGNMWVWHRKMAGTDGLELIKQGIILTKIPPNWRDHLNVIKKQSRKTLPGFIKNKEPFDEVVGRNFHTPLDSEHQKLFKFLENTNASWWWEQDHHMLVTHTIHLKEAFESINIKGFFDTVSMGKEKGADHNCFLFPMRSGGWSVRRYTQGVSEHESWEQDSSGWTRCYFNRDVDIKTAARANEGLEDVKGNFTFRQAEAVQAAGLLLGVNIQINSLLVNRPAKMTKHKDGRLIVHIERKDHDVADEMHGWLPEKGWWVRIFNSPQVSQESEIASYDDIVRHLVTESDEDYGWMIKSDNRWRTEPLAHIKPVLSAMGLKAAEITEIIGSSVMKCWKISNKPFEPEYPGEREWNRRAAQLKFTPEESAEESSFKTWTQILKHCGAGLNDAVKQNSWCRVNSILDGGDYLKCWIASLFQEPLEPLPYLFLYGPQKSGKSIFHEIFSELVTKGVKRADSALASQSGFNGELEGAILAVIEETDLKASTHAYNRIKDWVTSKEISIHAKGRTPYHIPNTTHWVQCANDISYCPVFPGDTRITVCYVEALNPLDLIPRKTLIPILQKEAPYFLWEILNMDIPKAIDRLNIPVITTEDKDFAQRINQTSLETFLENNCVKKKGSIIKFSDLFDKFVETLDPREVDKWSKQKFGRTVPPIYPKGRIRSDNQFYFGNIAWAYGQKDEEVNEEETVYRYLLDANGYLELINDD